MSYFSEWNDEIARLTESGENSDFIKDYYRLEQAAYHQILMDPQAKWEGSFRELQEKLGFGQDARIFAGFLEGVNTSLKHPLDLDSLNDESPIQLEINYETLLYNMHDAKANWLYDLEAWDNVFSPEKRAEIAKKFRLDHTAVSNKVGRNDPCPCGSGKKYKQCCGKPQKTL